MGTHEGSGGTPTGGVTVTRERVTIPTYAVGEPDRNPMFLEKRVYQGSSGVVYPYPVIDSISDEKHDVEWDAVYLENEYLRIMVLPALGGRVQMALDKTNGYHFVYHNSVIKPALVGLAGPWISGGIEFNWPQHHRPNTYGAVDCEIEQGDDGSVTVWCHEIDRMYGTRGMHGLRLRPGRAVLEIDVRLYNGTSLPQTFLWWANPACAVDENHQSMFPPDVRAVMDHGKRDVSDFPVATGEYYKVDYSPGTDISCYRNIPVPTSYMAYHSDFNYVGSYDWGRNAGLLHVANRHVSPGKKQWTWGHGAFGQAWDRHLTDDDGPYIELMCGVFTDNQPDFTWLLPGEQKSFVQHFMPYKGVGRLGDANEEGCIGIDVSDGVGVVRAYVTSERAGCVLALRDRATGAALAEGTFDATPAEHIEIRAVLAGTREHDLEATLTDASGSTIVCYRPIAESSEPIPEPAKAIGSPETLDSCESLYLAARHLEQYRHATRDPEPYLREALRRDAGDSRCNTALGQSLLRRGLYADADTCFRAAIDRLTRHSPNPVTGEAHLGLGLSLVAQGRDDEAEPVLWKAAWNEAEQSQAFFELGKLELRRASRNSAGLLDALNMLERCLRRNADHHQATHLRVETLFAMGRAAEAVSLAEDELDRDPFAFGVLWALAEYGHRPIGLFDARSRNDALTHLSLAQEYAAAGMSERAIAVLRRGVDRATGDALPMLRYHLAALLRTAGLSDEADRQLDSAAQMPRDRCFPNAIRDIEVLEDAVRRSPGDALAAFALGNLLYSRRRHDEAIAAWVESAQRDPGFATAHRNVGFALFNAKGDADGSWAAYTKAFAADERDSRVLYELDQLAKRLGHAPSERLDRLERYPALVEARDDLSIERVSLLNLLGRHDTALDRALARNFKPWEGGEGKVPAQYVFALTSLAENAIVRGRAAEALEYLDRAEQWPHSLGEGKLAGIQENDINYLAGLAFAQLGDDESSADRFGLASTGLSEPSAAMFYNDQPPEMIYFQGLALGALGQSAEASLRFESLVAYGESHLSDDPEIDYFAVSLPDFLIFEPDLAANNEAHCRLMIALGCLGLGRVSRASDELSQILSVNPAHLWATRLMRSIDRRASPAEVGVKGTATVVRT